MLESKLQSLIIKYLAKHKILALKWDCPGHAGVPDLICTSAELGVFFIEVKTPTGRLSKLQVHMIDKLNDYGATTYVVNCLEDIDTIIAERLNA